MTRPQFIRWANRREKAADALYEAMRWIDQMHNINGDGAARGASERAVAAINAAIGALSAALDHATSETKGDS